MKLYYDQPARNWHESLPMGNGRTGRNGVWGNEKRDTGAERGHTLVRLSGENAEGTSGRIPDQGPGADRETGVSESAGLSAGLLQDF